MHSSIVPTLFWGYWANIVYIFGMIGYLTIDTIGYIFISLNNTFPVAIYIILALLFVFDAILYTIDWYMYAVKLRTTKDEPIQYRAEFIACIFQNIGSVFYLIGALLTFDKNRLIKEILLFNFIGIISFLIESIFTILGWIIVFRRKSSSHPKNGFTIKNIYIWAHVLNIIGNIIYLCAIIIAYNLYRNQRIIYSNTISLLQIFGDTFFLFDAYLYHECWQRDEKEFEANIEQRNLNRVDLEKHNYDNK